MQPTEQPTAHGFLSFPRLGDGITFEVDFSKCHAIVQDSSGHLRQCKKGPTSAGNDSSICSTGHDITRFGKVTDGYQLPQEVQGTQGVQASPSPALERNTGHDGDMTQGPQDPSSGDRRVSDVTMPDASPTRSRRSNASEINERRPSGFVAVSDISSLRQQIREDVQKEMQRGAKEIHQVLCQGLADLIRKLHGKAVDLDPPPRSRINEDNIRGFEAAIKQTESQISMLSRNVIQARAKSKSLREKALEGRDYIKDHEDRFRVFIESRKSKNREDFAAADFHASKADEEQESADRLREKVADLMKDLDTERTPAEL